MADLRAIAHAPLRTVSPLQRYQAGPARLEIHGDVVLLASGVPGPDFNFVTVLGPVAPDEVFALADAFYAGGPYGVVLDVERAAALDEALRRGGWQLDEEEPALVLSPIPPAPTPPAELEIRRVATEADLDDFFTITGTARHRIPTLAAALDPAVALFVGYVDGQPVATARLSCHGSVGDLNGVVTAEPFRRRGIGAAMTWAAVEWGCRRGCHAVTLTATELGYPVYRRMGFVPACTFHTYLPAAPPGG